MSTDIKEATDQFSASLKSTLEKSELYSLLGSASALLFFLLALPEVRSQSAEAGVKWQLLGIPLEFQPAFGLVLVYLIYLAACVLTDNMLLHARDLISRLNNRDLVSQLLTHPTVLTVSPIGHFFVTVVPTLLVAAGLWLTHSRGVYVLPGAVWFLAFGFSLVGCVVYLRVRTILSPLLLRRGEYDDA